MNLAMVFVIDEGSKFKAPIEKVWKLASSEGQHSHPSMKNMKYEPSGETSGVLSWESDMPGGAVKNKVKMWSFPPLGYYMETIEGPMTGSKSFQYYIPKGKETGVTVVGDWKSPNMSDDQLKKAVLQFLETAFKEDTENLKKMS